MINYFELFSIIIIGVSILGVIGSKSKIGLIIFLNVTIFSLIILLAETVGRGDLLHFFTLPQAVLILFSLIIGGASAALIFLSSRNMVSTAASITLIFSILQILAIFENIIII